MTRASPAHDPRAGQPADPARLVDIPRLIAAYYEENPDAAIRAERVAFGTSGHRGSSLNRSFNERHIIAITQAICHFRRAHTIDSPLFIWFAVRPSGTEDIYKIYAESFLEKIHLKHIETEAKAFASKVMAALPVRQGEKVE